MSRTTRAARSRSGPVDKVADSLGGLVVLGFTASNFMLVGDPAEQTAGLVTEII